MSNDLIFIMLYIITAYLWGSIPFSYLIGLFYNVDIRKCGSNNVGATNVLRTCGKTAAIFAYTLDIAKGLFAGMFISSVAFSQQGEVQSSFEHFPKLLIIAYLAPVIGHTWSIFLGFKGGKGVATSAGILGAIAPVPLLLTLIVFGFFLFRTNVVGISSVIASMFLPIGCMFQMLLFQHFSIQGFQTQIHKNFPNFVQALCYLLSIVVTFLHKDNIKKWIQQTKGSK